MKAMRTGKHRMRKLAIGLLSVVVILGGILQPTALHEAMYGAMISAENAVAGVVCDHDHEHDHDHAVFGDTACGHEEDCTCGHTHEAEGICDHTDCGEACAASCAEEHDHAHGMSAGSLVLTARAEEYLDKKQTWYTIYRLLVDVPARKDGSELCSKISNQAVHNLEAQACSISVYKKYVKNQGGNVTCGVQDLVVYYICTYCRKVIESETEIIPNGVEELHSFEDFDGYYPKTYANGDRSTRIYPGADVLQYPTTTSEGSARSTCWNCGITKTVPIPVLGSGERNAGEPAQPAPAITPEHTTHTWDAGVVTRPATCAADGILTKTCTVCGQTTTETIAKTQTHTWNAGVITLQPTEAAEGVKTYTCTVCGATRTETVPRLVPTAHTTHTWNAGVITLQPTETAEGIRTFTCTVCNATRTETVPRLEKQACTVHTWNAGVITLQPTGTTDGIKTFTCTVCNATRTETIPRTGTIPATGGGNTDTDNQQEAGTENGAGDGTGNEGAEMPPAEHAVHIWNNGHITKPPTETEEGVRTYTCQYPGCTESRTEAVPKRPHMCSVWEWMPDEPATYQAAGYEKQACVTCGRPRQWRKIPKLECDGHTYGEWKTVKNATDIAEGQKKRSCTKCGASETETIPKAPHVTHVLNIGMVTKQPTVSEEGIRDRGCTICGARVQEIIPKLPHSHSYDYKNGGVLSNPDDGKGNEVWTYTCTVAGCGQKTTRTVKKACTHPAAYIRESVKEAGNCGRDRIVSQTCLQCGEVVADRVNRGKQGNHTYVRTEQKAPTYSEEGRWLYKCSVCGDSYTATIPKKTCPHKNVVDKPFLIDGKHHWFCNDCNTYYKVTDRVVTPEPCKHNGPTEQVEVVKASATTNGRVETRCKNCGYVKDSTTIHAYQAYTVNGKTVYGYYDRSAGAEILSLTNAYRRSNGRSSLSDNPGWQEYADIRAREQALDYSHTRPNGEKWYTLLPNVLRAENLAESKTTNPTGIMAAWKNSSGHNANLLNQDFNRLAVGCFHVMVFTGGSKIPSETVYWVQLFSRQ